jgi:hypothetical protein
MTLLLRPPHRMRQQQLRPRGADDVPGGSSAQIAITAFSIALWWWGSPIVQGQCVVLDHYSCDHFVYQAPIW